MNIKEKNEIELINFIISFFFCIKWIAAFQRQCLRDNLKKKLNRANPIR